MDNKKKTAAIAAVMYYLKSEEEAAMQIGMQPAAEKTLPPVPMKLWAVSGRQAQMQMRNLMQLKALR
ncbi:MAG: hypothetical protein GY749_15700 [Desulfobacteraceae bacterium]|nr:hypothetical protein [Desulfobacteraceae bacterium]